jgi:pimeloyl-ACP methyl ester carboxylesterase
MYRFRSLSGLQLAADIGGNPARTPVVLLHGGGQTRHSWGNVFSALVATGYHVITFDARGHGDSDWDANGDYTLDAMVADLHAVLAELPSPPILVGTSMACSWLARRRAKCPQHWPRASGGCLHL